MSEIQEKTQKNLKCKCGKEAIIFRPYEGRALCKEHFIYSFEKKVKKTIREFKLVEKNDKIAVGLSGGPDSSTLLFLLNKFFRERKDIEIFAIFVNEGIPNYREKLLKWAKILCNNLEIPLHVFTFKKEYGISLKEIVGRKKIKEISPCTYCGVLRRDVLNRRARELGATKLAIGHNLDDEVESILMNYMKGDLQRLARLGPKTAIISSDKFVPRIKPMIYIPKKEITLYAKLSNLKTMPKACPYGGESFRFEVRDFINKMEEEHPTTKFSVLNTFLRIHPSLLKSFKGESKKLRGCKICGEPTNREICKKCELLKRIGAI